MARPKGARQTRPTRSDVHEYYKLLRDKARKGDVNAAGMLLLNDTATRYLGLQDSQPLSESTALRLACNAAAYMPRSEWHALPEEVIDLAETILRKVAELVAKEEVSA